MVAEVFRRCDSRGKGVDKIGEKGGERGKEIEKESLC